MFLRKIRDISFKISLVDMQIVLSGIPRIIAEKYQNDFMHPKP